MGPETEEQFMNDQARHFGIGKKTLKRLGYYPEYSEGRGWVLKKKGKEDS